MCVFEIPGQELSECMAYSYSMVLRRKWPIKNRLGPKNNLGKKNFKKTCGKNFYG